MVKISDSKDRQILYDKSLLDFQTIIHKLKKISSYFIENNLIDFCFDSVKIEDFKMEDNRGFTHRHMKMKITDEPKSINVEYVVFKVLKAEADFQAAKVRTIETMFSLMNHMSNQKSIHSLIKSINGLILRKPDLDFEKFNVLNDSLREVCNNRVNQTDINVASLRKEIQNHMLTIFDNYDVSTRYLVKYNSLLKKFIKEQHRISKSCNMTQEIKSVSDIFQKKTEKFIKIEDNYDVITSLEEGIEDGITHIMENLLDFDTMDKLTLTDEVVEENHKEYLKSMNIKILDPNKKVSAGILGKGMKEITTVNFLRIFIRNRLEGRQGFIKGNIRILFINEILRQWAEVNEGFSQEVLSMNSGRMVNSNDTRQSMFSRALTQLQDIKTEIQTEKRSTILTSQDDPWEILRSKSSYLKSEFKERIEILNSIHLVDLFVTNQIKIRELFDSLSPIFEIFIHQKNNFLVKNNQFGCGSKEKMQIVESIFDMDGKLTTKLSCLQRILKLELNSCWDVEKAKRSISLIADSKAIFEYISALSIFFKNCVYSNNLVSKTILKETVDEISNLFTIKQLAEKVISNMNITFKEEEPTLASQRSNSSFAIYYDDPVYLTSRIKASGTEILYSSKNESMVRRLVLHSLYEKLPKYFIDPTKRLEKAKERAFSIKGDEVSVRKVNYYYEHQMKARKRAKMKRRTSKIKLDEGKRKKLETCRFEPCQKMSELLIYLRREGMLIANHLDTLSCYTALEKDIAPYSSWFRVFTKNISSNFKLENINKFFWMAISNKEIEHSFLTEDEIKKGFLEAVENFGDDKANKSEILFSLFPGFMNKKSKRASSPLRRIKTKTNSTLSEEALIPPFHHLKNMEELHAMLMQDSVDLMRRQIFPFELTFLTNIIVSQFTLPEGLFVDRTEIGRKKETSLSKLLGRTGNRKSKGKTIGSKNKQFSAEKYQRISAYAKNYYNNSLDFVLEQILLNSALFNQPSYKEPMEVQVALEQVSCLKFRTNMKGPIMEEDRKNMIFSKSIEAKNKQMLFDMMNEFQEVSYNSYLQQIKILVKLFTLLSDLDSNQARGNSQKAPTWLLKHIRSSELELIYNKDEIVGMQHEQEISYLKDMTLKILDIDDINKVHAENDSYDAQGKNKIESNIIAYMKKRSLYSINYSQNSSSNSLRNCDLRLRVYFYEMQRRERETLGFFYDIRKYLSKYYRIESEDSLEILRKKTTIMQNELVLSVFDLIFRLTWSFEKNSSRDKEALEGYKELLKILKNGDERLEHLKDIDLCPNGDIVSMRNLDIHKHFRKIFTEEIDVLKYMGSSNFKGHFHSSYSSSFHFLEKKSKFHKIREWIKKNTIFTNKLLHKKIKSSDKNWVFYEGRIIKSLFHSTGHSREQSVDGDNSNDNSLFVIDDINTLRKREEILGILIKNCDLIEFLTDNIGKQGLELEIDKEKVKSLSNRSNLTHKVKMAKFERNVDKNYLAHFFKNFMLDMVIHYQIMKSKNKDVVEAINMYKKVTRKPVKSGLSVDSFDHFYHLNLNLPSLMMEIEDNKSNYLNKMRARARKKDSEVDKYVTNRLDCTFMVPETEQIISNLGYILKLCIKRIINQKKEILGLQSVFFKRVNQNMEARIIEKKMSRRSIYGSAKNLEALTQVLAKKDQINEVTLTKRVFDMEKDRYLPFLLKSYQAILDSSHTIMTKSKEKHIIINKDIFVQILGTFVKEMCLYFQTMDSDLINLYGTVIDKEYNKLKIKSKEVDKLTEKFSDFVENFHKHIEARMAEVNFQTIYKLDQYAKLIKYTHYDTSVNYENLHQRISQKFDDELVKLLLLNKQLEDRLVNYKKGMTLDMREFVSQKYNESMVQIR